MTFLMQSVLHVFLLILKMMFRQEFGDKGCMDAAYALGLWRAGSRFEVVHNAGIKLEEPSAQPLVTTSMQQHVKK